jgi:curli biogenesis system outer membrane secretion channel CsgG
MKKTFSSALSVVVVAAVCAAVTLTAQAPAGQAAAASGRRPRIAILDFDYATVHTAVSAVFGTNVDVGKGITDLLISYLVKDGSFSIIERRALDKIMAEQNFSNSDRADSTSAAKIGKLLGVDAMVVGSVTQFGNDTKNTGVGGVGGGLGKLGLGGFNQKKTKAIVGLTARIVNIDTAEILASAESLGESQRTSTSMAGFGGGWSGFGGGAVNFGSSDFQNTIIGEAVKAAVEKMSTQMVSDRGRVATRSISISGLVAAVTGSQIVLNVGGKAGVKVGDQMSVQRVGSEIKDPATGKVIRRITTSVGIVKVVDVDDQSSVAEVVSGSGFKVGDLVKGGS